MQHQPGHSPASFPPCCHPDVRHALARILRRIWLTLDLAVPSMTPLEEVLALTRDDLWLLLTGEGKGDSALPQADGHASGAPGGLAEQALLLQEQLEGLQDSVLFAPEDAGEQAPPAQCRGSATTPLSLSSCTPPAASHSQPAECILTESW